MSTRLCEDIKSLIFLTWKRSLNTILLPKNQIALVFLPFTNSLNFLSFKAHYLAIITLESSIEGRIKKQRHCYMNKIVLSIKMVFIAKINSVTGSSSPTPQAFVDMQNRF